jgi:hypothetical protein
MALEDHVDGLVRLRLTSEGPVVRTHLRPPGQRSGRNRAAAGASDEGEPDGATAAATSCANLRLCACENPGHLSPGCRVLISSAFQRRIRVVQAPDDMVRLESATGEDIQARLSAAVSRRRGPGYGSSAMRQAMRQHAACGW